LKFGGVLVGAAVDVCAKAGNASPELRMKIAIVIAIIALVEFFNNALFLFSPFNC